MTKRERAARERMNKAADLLHNMRPWSPYREMARRELESAEREWLNVIREEARRDAPR